MFLANHKIKCFLLLAILKIILIPKISWSQTLSTPTGKLLVTEVEDLFLPSESGKLKLDLSNEYFDSKYWRLAQIPENINIRQIKIVGNTVFSTAELEALIGAEQKTTISKDNLRSIIEKINKLYQDNGYITSRVSSEQKIKRNELIINPVTEGRIEDITISGLTRLRNNYVRNRLFRDKKQILNVDRLKESLQLLQINHLIKDISGTLVPGSSIGSNILDVEVREDDQF